MFRKAKLPLNLIINNETSKAFISLLHFTVLSMLGKPENDVVETSHTLKVCI